MTPLFNIRGEKLVTLSSGDDDGDVLQGDIDGDGAADLLVEMEKLVQQVKVYGKHGSPLTQFLLQSKLTSAVAGDTDGDGKQELLNIEFGQLACYARKQERREIEQWPYGMFPSACYDLNADGVEEIIALHTQMIAPDYLDPVTREFKGLPPDADKTEFLKWVKQNARPRGGIFDPISGAFTNFELPEGVDWRMNIFTGERSEIGFADYDRDGEVEIIAKSAVGTALLIFNRKGQVEYYEEFGAPALNFGVARTAKQRHIVVQLDTRVLTYP